MADVSVVVAGDSTFDVHAARRNLAFLVLEILQVKRLCVAVLIDIDHTSGLTL